MSRSRRIIISAVVVLAAVAGLAAEQGMWMPQQIPDLAAKLRTLGFTGDPRAFADLTGQPMGASSRSADARRRSSRPTG